MLIAISVGSCRLLACCPNVCSKQEQPSLEAAFDAPGSCAGGAKRALRPRHPWLCVFLSALRRSWVLMKAALLRRRAGERRLSPSGTWHHPAWNHAGMMWYPFRGFWVSFVRSQIVLKLFPIGWLLCSYSHNEVVLMGAFLWCLTGDVVHRAAMSFSTPPPVFVSLFTRLPVWSWVSLVSRSSLALCSHVWTEFG